MKTSLLITTYDSPKELYYTLQFVGRLSPMPDEIIVCDDGSTSSTKEVMTNFTKKTGIKLIHSYQESLGWRVSRSRNLGIDQATGDYIIMIDGDCLVPRDFIKAHLSVSRNETLIFGSRVHLNYSSYHKMKISFWQKIRMLSQKGTVKKRKLLFSFCAPKDQIVKRIDVDDIGQLAFVNACNFAAYKKDLLKLQGFDEKYSTWAPEDLDLATRALNRGMSIMSISKKATLFHMDHPSSIPNSVGDIFNEISIRYQSGKIQPEKSLFAGTCGS